MNMIDMIEIAIPITIYGILIIGSIYQLLKILLFQIRRYKSDSIDKKRVREKFKIGLIAFGLVYGCTPIFLIILGLFSTSFNFEVSRWFYITFAILYVPYFAAVFGLAYGIGLGSGYSGISAEKMADSLGIKSDIKK